MPLPLPLPVPLPRPHALALSVWSNLEKLGGIRLREIPPQHVVAVRTPDAIGRVERLALTLVPTAPAIGDVHLRRVLRLEETDAAGVVVSIQEWRILSDTLSVGAGTGTDGFEVTAVQPLLDWGTCGHVRETLPSGAVNRTFSGILTPTELLDGLCLPYLAAQGNTAWTRGVVARDDARAVDLDGVTPLEILRKIEDEWRVEAAPRRLADGTHVLDLPVQRGKTAGAPLVLDVGGAAAGAVVSLQRTRDATDLATVVLPVGQGGADIGNAVFVASAIDPVTRWVDVVDQQGGPGPVLLPDQYVGRYVETEAGTRHLIEATAIGDGSTSQLQLAAVDDIAVGEWLRFVADADGTRLVTVEDPARLPDPPVGFGRVEVSVPREGLRGDWNLVKRPYLRPYTSAAVLPDGWELQVPGSYDAGVLGAPVTERASAPPVGNPLGDELAAWRVQLSRTAFVTYSFALRSPVTPVVTAREGDAQLSGYFALYIDALMSRVLRGSARVSGYGDAPTEGVGKAVRVALLRLNPLTGLWEELAGGTTWKGRQWLLIGPQGATFTGATRYRLEVRPIEGQALVIGPTYNGGPIYIADIWQDLFVYVAFAQITRTGLNVAPLEGSGATALQQIGNAYLVDHSSGPTALESLVIDRAQLDPDRYGDQVLTLGRDVVVRVNDVEQAARIVGRAPNPAEPGQPERVGIATPSQRKSLTEEVWSWIRRTGRGAAGTSTSSGDDAATFPGTIASDDDAGAPTTGGTSGGTSPVSTATALNQLVPILAHSAGLLSHVQQAGAAIPAGDPVEWSRALARLLDLKNAKRVRWQGYRATALAGAAVPAGAALILAGTTDGDTWLGLNGKALDDPDVGPVFALDGDEGYVPGDDVAVDKALQLSAVLVGVFVRGLDGTVIPRTGDLFAELLPSAPDPLALSGDGWRWVNRTSAGKTATYAAAADAIELGAPAVDGENWRLRVRDLPETPWQLLVRARPTFAGSAGAFPRYPSCGVFVGDADGRFHALVVGANNTQGAPGGCVAVYHMDSPTHYASGDDHFGAIPSLSGVDVQYKIIDDGTDLHFSYRRADDASWSWIHLASVSRTSFLVGGPTVYGFCVNAGGDADASMRVLEYALTDYVPDP